MKVQLIYKICSSPHAINLLQISEQLWIISNSQIGVSSTRGSLWPRCVGTSEKIHTDPALCHTKKGTVCCFWDQIYCHTVSTGTGAVELVTSVKFNFKRRPLEICFFFLSPTSWSNVLYLRTLQRKNDQIIYLHDHMVLVSKKLSFFLTASTGNNKVLENFGLS